MVAYEVSQDLIKTFAWLVIEDGGARYLSC